MCDMLPGICPIGRQHLYLVTRQEKGAGLSTRVRNIHVPCSVFGHVILVYFLYGLFAGLRAQISDNVDWRMA